MTQNQNEHLENHVARDAVDRKAALLRMSHELGRDDLRMAILGEGNTSTRVGPDTFLVKASGSSLRTLTPNDVVECRMSALLQLMKNTNLGDSDVDAALFASRIDPNGKKPSLEALFHASLLSLPDVEFVGHVHATAVAQILCSPRAREFAEHRIVPDEIVCCGVASVYVPYADPGLELARQIRTGVMTFVEKHARSPRVILLENHGIITIGRTPEAVVSAMLMAEKVANIWLGAAALGGPVFLKPEQVERIADRPDEKYRQKVLSL